MTCHDIADYMQRHLDHDLNEQEAAVLNAHTRHCSDCAEMFDRLKRLSAELDNLPKVVPAFSLVDAIMPLLDTIELERPIAIARATATMSPEQDQAAANDKFNEQERSLRPREGERRKRFSWPLVSGIVGVGVAMGLFLVLINPIMPPSGSKDEAAGMKSTADSTAFTGTTESTTSPAADEVRIESTLQSSSGAADEPASPGEIERKSDKKLSDTVDESESGKFQVTVPYAEVPGEQYNTDADEQVLPPADVHTTYNKTTSSTDGSTDAGSQAGAEEGGAVPETGSSIASIAKDQYGEEMGITSNGDSTKMDVSNTVQSPNGEMTAAIVDKAVFIYSAQEGTVLLESNKLAGEIGSLQWSDDGMALFFSVKDTDGQSSRYKVDTKEWSITKQ